MKPRIFLSAVTSEFRQTRQLAANILQRLGYDPVWQDIFSTEAGDLRQILREKIDDCDGLIHLVGFAYGAEPPTPDPEFGRVSYTQYELLYARKKWENYSHGKKTWVIIANKGFPSDLPLEKLDLPADPRHSSPATFQAECHALQGKWRKRITGDSHLWHGATTRTEFELQIERLKDDFSGIRRTFRFWQQAVIAALLAILLIGVGIWWTIQGKSRELMQTVDQTFKKSIDKQTPEIAARVVNQLLAENIRSQTSGTARNQGARTKTNLQVRFDFPEGTHIGWQIPGGFAENQMIAPGSINLQTGNAYQLKLTSIPHMEDLVLYPRLELYDTSSEYADILSSSKVNLNISEREVEQAVKSGMVIKVYYLSKVSFPHTSVVSNLHDDFNPDVVSKVLADGSVVAVMRIGNIDLEMPNVENISPKSPDQDFILPPSPVQDFFDGDTGLFRMPERIPLTKYSQSVPSL